MMATEVVKVVGFWVCFRDIANKFHDRLDVGGELELSMTPRIFSPSRYKDEVAII